jgi:hypothetical protein
MGRIVVTLAVVALLAPPIHAQGSAVELRLAAGLALPTGGDPGVGPGFTTSYNGGFTVGAGLGRRIVPGLVAALTLDYSRFVLDERGYGGGSVSGGALSILSFGVDLRYTLSAGAARAAPYIVAGASGLKLSDVDIASSGPFGSQETRLTRHGLAQDLGLHVGVGVQVRAGPSTRLLLEARAVIGTYGQASYVPVRAGVAFGL